MSIFKRKDSPNWWLKITAPNGRCIQQSAGTTEKIKAKEFHDKLKASLWDQYRLGIKHDLAKLRWLDPILGRLNLAEITLEVIDLIRAAKLKEASKPTVNRYLALVRAILLKARDQWEWIDKVPKIKLFKEIASRERSLTPEQAKRLLTELPSHQRETVLFALATGLRQSNILGLEWSKVDLQRQHAWVPSISSKNGRPIAVPLNTMAIEVLIRQKEKHITRVFTYRGKPIANANTKAWKRALKRAEITGFRWHDLRHTWATWQRQAGTPTHELQRLGGWRTGAMVERYAHIAPDYLSMAAGRIDGILSAATI
jgi:integrase